MRWIGDHSLAPRTLDPDDPIVRSAAARLAVQFDDDPEVGRVVRSMLVDIAGGERVAVLRTEEEVTPAQAARILGVSRQYVDRLCDDEILPFRRLPGSRHRRVRVHDVVEVAAERDQHRTEEDLSPDGWPPPAGTVPRVPRHRGRRHPAS